MCVEFYSLSDPHKALDFAKAIQRAQQGTIEPDSRRSSGQIFFSFFLHLTSEVIKHCSGPFSDFVSPQAIARLRAANEKTNAIAEPSDSGTSLNSGGGGSEIAENIRY